MSTNSCYAHQINYVSASNFTRFMHKMLFRLSKIVLKTGLFSENVSG
ncbi:hypothetical protein T11_3758 [Trichinella zimbabwensis]|uniref:Uncharacterized protein n=1 Tax=Trichinella zimbabwensis TaxID=268475 RepID=A0A0V1GKM6_9BILA|nr:hypothetical protein T11_3758 [Trichinella zimbabwensis]